MAQQIRFLYDELREPNPKMSLQQLGRIVTRTFDALDTQGATTINSTTNITNIVAGLWTQTGIRLYPTVLNSAVLVGMTNSDVGGLSQGYILSNSVIGVLNATINANALFFSVNGLTETVIHSSFSGTATSLPLSLYLNGVRYFTLQTSGALLGGIFTTDVSPTAGMIVLSSAYFLVTTTTNASTFQIHAGSGVFEFVSSSTGTGAILPVRFSMGGGEIARWTTGGTLFVGIASSDFQPNNQPGAILAQVQIGVVSAATNANAIRMVSITGSQNYIQVTTSGTATLLPLQILMGATEVARFETTGRLLVGLTSSDAANNLGDLYISNFFGILSATTNASALFMSINGTTETVIHSSFSGTGTVLPLSFYVNGVRRCTVTTAGGFIVGELSSDFFSGHCLVGDAGSGMGLISAATNADVLLIRETSNLMQIDSSHSGTGTTRPLQFAMTESEIARFETNGRFLLGVASSDATSGTGILYISNIFGVISAATNATALFLSINGTTETVIHSSFSGTGTVKPMSFYVNGTRMWTIDTSGVLIGRNVSNASYGAINGRILTPGDVIITTGYTANESFLRAQIAGGAASIETAVIGTGTQLDLLFKVGPEIARMISTGQLLVGLTSGGDYTGSAGRIVVSNDLIVATATTNSSFIRMIVTASTGELESGRTGTGTFLRMRFVTNAAEQATIDTTGRFILGFASSDSGGAGSLLSSFTCGVISAAVNAHAILMSVNGTTETVLHSTFSGAGTSLPLSLYVNAVRGMTLTVANPVHVLIGTNVDDGTGALLQVHGTISSNGTVLTVP